MRLQFAGLSVILGADTREMLGVPETKALLRGMMQEVVDAAAKVMQFQTPDMDRRAPPLLWSPG